jgi:hypothetical protein
VARKVLVYRFFEDRRREGPKFLAVLDPIVDAVAGVGPARIGEDAAVAEGPRAPLYVF